MKRILFYKDIVNVYFDHTNSEYEVELHEIRERFGKFGREKIQPLCTGVIVKVIREEEKFSSITSKRKVGKKIFFDYVFIRYVVSRSGLGDFPKINVHKRTAQKSLRSIQVKRDKKLLCGPVQELCRIYLGKLNEQIIVDADWDKIKNRVKTLTGVVDKYCDFVYTVKKNHFEHWFKKNWRHILQSKAVANELATQENIRMINEYGEYGE